MRRNLCVGLVCAAVLTMGWLEACGKPQTLTGPSSSLIITAPPYLKLPGQSGQLTAQEVLGSNSTADVTTAVAWFSSSPNVATVSASGFVTLIATGTTTIRARLPSGLSGTLSLTVVNQALPVSGRVSEAGGFGLPQVLVTMIGGLKDGVTALTDQYGQYSVLDGFGAQQVRAEKDGYITATVPVGGDPRQVNITLNPTTPYADLNGSWRLTFTASSTCQLPNEALTWTNTASIAQDNARLTIRLSGAQFGSAHSTTENWIDGRVSGNNVTLTLGKTDDACFYYGQCLVEQLADGSYLALDGTATGSVNGNGLTTLLAGAVTLTGASTVACTAADHHLTFTR